jgi:2-oxo-4-hydroxy-4-carboxy-5-ureidoimidazoline decarboxylase
LSDRDLQNILLQCCGCRVWAEKLTETRPYRDLNDLIEKSNSIWYTLEEECWKEAFAKHPRIGDIESLREKFSQHHTWSKDEQGSVSHTDEVTLITLRDRNEEYYNKFGYIFIVFATGKSAKEMLEILEKRLHNKPEEELIIAAREQNKITRLRLEKLQDRKT